MSELVIYLLEDYTSELYRKALEAREMCRQRSATAAASESSEFYCGRAEAYYEVLSVLINRAQAFGVDKEISSLKDINLDSLLS